MHCCLSCAEPTRPHEDQPNFWSEHGQCPAQKKVDRLTNQPTHFTLLQVDGFPLVSAVSRTLLASQSTHLTEGKV